MISTIKTSSRFWQEKRGRKALGWQNDAFKRSVRCSYAEDKVSLQRRHCISKALKMTGPRKSDKVCLLTVWNSNFKWSGDCLLPDLLFDIVQFGMFNSLPEHVLWGDSINWFSLCHDGTVIDALRIEIASDTSHRQDIPNLKNFRIKKILFISFDRIKNKSAKSEQRDLIGHLLSVQKRMLNAKWNGLKENEQKTSAMLMSHKRAHYWSIKSFDRRQRVWNASMQLKWCKR